MYPINKREIPATPKIYDILEALAARHLARCSPSVFFKVLATREKNLTTARARKNKHTARMLENTRKDHSIPLLSFFI
ncbi:unnamed protein product [Pocillopora meandrina]|uniref:Uncharacterized protein n=1 Tax=Pocillopora meandrina TaxID=46732 RepID=A0AAU9X941_9CNID|nr:unnamed protein product [Pocillopora meandrina]